MTQTVFTLTRVNRDAVLGRVEEACLLGGTAPSVFMASKLMVPSRKAFYTAWWTSWQEKCSSRPSCAMPQTVSTRFLQASPRRFFVQPRSLNPIPDVAQRRPAAQAQHPILRPVPRRPIPEEFHQVTMKWHRLPSAGLRLTVPTTSRPPSLCLSIPRPPPLQPSTQCATLQAMRSAPRAAPAPVSSDAES